MKFLKLVLLISALCLIKILPLQAENDDSLSLADLVIPPSLGKIEEKFVGSPDSRWVIHIQDVHAHLGAQENIAAIIDHLNVVYGIKNVALEGGWSSSSFPISWGIPSSREKQMLAQALLEDDYITGPAQAALFSQSPILLSGIEDEKLYQDNRKIYLEHLSERAEVAKKIDGEREKMQSEKKTIFNPALLGFDNALIAFREGKKADTFIPSLISLCQDQKVDVADLDQIVTFTEIIKISGFIEKEKLEAEAARLTQNLQNKHISFEELLKSGKIPAEKLEFYPHSQKYLEVLKLQEKISHRIFFEQIETAVKHLKEKLFASDEEKNLDRRSEHLFAAKKILLFQATADELKAYASEKSDFDAESAAMNLKEAFDLALNFYETAKKRDEVFYKKIAGNADLKGNIAVVTGGFHTDGLRERLTQAKISFIIISPDLGNAPFDEALYFKRLQENPFSSQALAEFQDSFLKPGFDTRFAEAAHDLVRSKNITIAESIVVGNQVGGTVTATNAVTAVAPELNIQNLSREEQVAKVRALFEKLKGGQLPIVLVLKTTTLAKLLQEKTGTGRALWLEYIASNKANTIVEVRDSDQFLDETVGIKARVIRIQTLEEKVDFDAVIAKRFNEPKKARTIAVIDPAYQGKDVLSLPAEPISLFLARLMLEHSLPQSLDPNLQNLLDEIVREALIQDGLIKRAA